MDSEISDRNAEISNENAGRVNIPFIAFESVQARNERQMKRLWITVILLAVLLFVSNERIAEKHDLSVRYVKTLIYRLEDRVFEHL